MELKILSVNWKKICCIWLSPGQHSQEITLRILLLYNCLSSFHWAVTVLCLNLWYCHHHVLSSLLYYLMSAIHLYLHLYLAFELRRLNEFACVHQLEQQIWSFSESTTIMYNTQNAVKWVRNPNKVQTFPSFGIQDTLTYYTHFNGNDLFIYGILF